MAQRRRKLKPVPLRKLLEQNNLLASESRDYAKMAFENTQPRDVFAEGPQCEPAPCAVDTAPLIPRAARVVLALIAVVAMAVLFATGSDEHGNA